MGSRIGWLGGLALLVSGAAQAVPAHYIVFEVDAGKHVRPLYYREVELAGDGAARTGAAHDAAIAYHLRKAGVDRGVREVSLAPVRAEFARDPERGDNAIVTAPVAPDTRHFVLRVPRADADEVEFGEGVSKQRFVLADLAANARSLEQAQVAPLQVRRGAGAGNPANRVDMLVLGDGYTAAQQALFDNDTMILHDSFFGLTPYREYQSFVNWTTGFVASNESGADHPPYQAGCNRSSCCGDADAQHDPLAGQFVDTAFNATFCAYQIHRLLVVDQGRVLAAAAAYPDWDQIVVVINDPVYGGSGGYISTTSTHAQAAQIVLHEYGHSFTGLADEYSSPYPGFPPCSDRSGNAPCEPNVTDETTVAAIKWQSWLTPGNPIPTPPGTPGVGLFEGARYQSIGMYRPADTRCLMQYLGMPFCPVCAQEYVRTLYRGGFGEPADGIDLIEPGSESPSPGVPVVYEPGTTVRFEFTPLRPNGPIDIQWYLDGAPVPGATAEAFDFSEASPDVPSHVIEVRVTDLTPLVHADMADGLLEHRREWTIQVEAERIFRDGFDPP